MKLRILARIVFALALFMGISEVADAQRYQRGYRRGYSSHHHHYRARPRAVYVVPAPAPRRYYSRRPYRSRGYYNSAPRYNRSYYHHRQHGHRGHYRRW